MKEKRDTTDFINHTCGAVLVEIDDILLAMWHGTNYSMKSVASILLGYGAEAIYEEMKEYAFEHGLECRDYEDTFMYHYTIELVEKDFSAIVKAMNEFKTYKEFVDNMELDINQFHSDFQQSATSVRSYFQDMLMSNGLDARW